jgi:type II secretory pathway predicted ATPase ExeA
MVETILRSAPLARPPLLPAITAMHVPSRHPSSRPFMASPRTQFYHAAQEIDGALRGLERCVRRAEGIGLVVGSPGTGKSLLLLKLAEQLRDDFDVALLTGTSICTRRALWQSILAAIGEPYRGIDEPDLRIAIVERIRGLAAAGSGLAILVDEANTLPTRLIEELRLLTNIPTPLPAVHLVLAGTPRLDELLGSPRMESLAQRVAVRGYLEPLDHAETLAYLRTQTAAAGLDWCRLFADGCDDAVYRVTEGVPRLINQVCDQALVVVAECNRRVTPGDIAAAWREIQRLPAPGGLDPRAEPRAVAGPGPALDDLGGDGLGVIEFGADDGVVELGGCDGRGPADRAAIAPAADSDPWGGPDVELMGGDAADPFEAFFDRDANAPGLEADPGRDDFSDRRHVTSREGQAIGKILASIARDASASRNDDAVPRAQPGPTGSAPRPRASVPQPDPPTGGEVEVIDDSDMVVIEEDLGGADAGGQPTVFAVRPSDYRSLFTRLRHRRG